MRVVHLVRFVTEALPNGKKCSAVTKNSGEDVEIAKCLDAVGVKAGDSRDVNGYHRFFSEKRQKYCRFLALSPDEHFNPTPANKKTWFFQWGFYPFTPGIKCCSSVAVSFHYIKPTQMSVSFC